MKCVMCCSKNTVNNYDGLTDCLDCRGYFAIMGEEVAVLHTYIENKVVVDYYYQLNRLFFINEDTLEKVSCYINPLTKDKATVLAMKELYNKIQKTQILF